MGRLIDPDDYRNCYIGMDGEYEKWNIDPNVIAEAQPEGICESCLHQELEWDEEPCDGCTVGGDTNHYKPSMGRRTDERTD